MPNTLAHLGVQSIISKTIFRPVDVKWVGLGCIIPDLPWIIQRLVHPLGLVDPVDLRLYVIIQSSLLFSLLPAAAIALQVRNGRKIFLVLAVNILLHLLLDPTQTKWANGTHLAAPFSWHLLQFGWYWPEDRTTLVLTLAGLVLFPLFAWQDRNREIVISGIKKHRVAGGILGACYLLLPLLLLQGPLRADNHYTATLKNTCRSGLAIEIDRKPYRAGDRTIIALNDERFRLEGGLPDHDCTLSLQGVFRDHHTILVSKYHVHSGRRDIFSIIGLAMVLFSWLLALLRKRIRMGQA
jgi:hypothetical protein